MNNIIYNSPLFKIKRKNIQNLIYENNKKKIINNQKKKDYYNKYGIIQKNINNNINNNKIYNSKINKLNNNKINELNNIDKIFDVVFNNFNNNNEINNYNNNEINNNEINNYNNNEINNDEINKNNNNEINKNIWITNYYKEKFIINYKNKINLLKLNDEWDYYIYNNDDINTFILNYKTLKYNNIKIYKWLFNILYSYGGVYLDIINLQSNLLKNLDTYFNDNIKFSFFIKDNNIIPHIIYSNKKNILLKYILEYLNKIQHTNSRFTNSQFTNSRFTNSRFTNSILYGLIKYTNINNITINNIKYNNDLIDKLNNYNIKIYRL